MEQQSEETYLHWDHILKADDVNWTVPSDASIGTQTLSFVVDPDENVTADANRTNNYAS